MTATQADTAIEVDAVEVFEQWFTKFAAALTTPGTPGLKELIAPDGWWRDFVGLDWQLASYQSPETIAEFVASAPQGSVIRAEAVADPGPTFVDAGEMGWVEGFFSFETEVVEARGHVRLVKQADGEYRSWTVLTAVDSLKSHPMQTRHRRRRPGRDAHLEPWHVRQADKSSFDRPDPRVLVIGAGGGGLSVGACLETMGIDTLLVEKNERVGDNWRNRYEALVLHSPCVSDELPFMGYPSNWPLYPTKEKYGDWLESFQKASDVNVWTSSEVVEATFDPHAKRWTVRIDTPAGERVLHPEELIVATGFSGKAKLPDVPGVDAFKGRIMHSQDYRSADGFEGKKAVVVGAGTSAHDIAEDLYHRGVEVTMIQRSGSYIMSREGGNSVLYMETFHEDALPKEWLDLQAMSFPWPLAMQMAPAQTARIAEIDKELLDGLRGVGFELIAGDPVVGPNSGLLSLGIREGGPGNYYIDAGASQLIIDGKIKLRSGVGLVGYTETGVKLSDGSEIEADLVLCATGFETLREASQAFLGEEVVSQLPPLGGLDHRNERSLQYQPSGYPRLRFTGGGLYEVRQYSKFVAIQVAAEMTGEDGKGN
ncbi:MAG: NAD(P)/FAD-dependent oxidoreductase [Aeromicrobium sp.]